MIDSKDKFPFPLPASLDKSSWPRGEWDNEPDYLAWIEEDLHCAVIRTESGHLCGYVMLPDNCPELNEADLSVHGGITYNKDGWIGFDCAHYRDLVPGYDFCNQEIYRNLTYVKSEVKYLCEQIKDRIRTNSPKLTSSQRDQTFVSIVADALNEYREAGGEADQAIIMLLEAVFRVALVASGSKMEAIGRYLGLADSISSCTALKLLRVDSDWAELKLNRERK